MSLSEDLPKLISRISIGALVGIGLFSTGAYFNDANVPPVPQVKSFWEAVTAPDANPVSKHLQPARGQGEGVVKNTLGDDGALVMLTGFFEGENQIRLVRRDGTVAHKWPLHYFDHFPDLASRPCKMTNALNVDMHGALVHPNGDLVFNYEYCGTVKLDQCGDVQWTVNQKTHHSLIRAEGGGYLLLGRYLWQTSEYPDRFPPFTSPLLKRRIQEDTIVRLREDGTIAEEYSIPVAMQNSGLEAVLTATGTPFSSRRGGRRELVHANKVAELTSDIADAFPLFEPGDLAISMRMLNLVIVVDPDTRLVKWHQTGPWLRQHDPEFRPDGRISIFNNNVYNTSYLDKQVILSSPFKTNIIVMDPVTRETEVVFGEAPGEEMLSVIRGQHELLPDGGMLIIEFDAGRVLQVSADREIVWDYVNAYDEDFVGEITDAAVYPEGYFTTDWQGCS